MTREEAMECLNHSISVAEFIEDKFVDNVNVEAIKIAIEALEQEPCEDVISRQAVLEIQVKYAEHMGATKYWQMRDDIRALLPVTPQPKTGHWEWQTEDIYRCSECGEDIHVKEVMNVPQYEFCPICGAKMESEG